MKRQKKTAKAAPNAEQLIQRVIRTSGYIFPETVEEVKEFEKIFGATDVMLPEHLQHPSFLFTIKEHESPVIKMHKNVTALAARHEGEGIPDDIRKKMDKDREQAMSNLKIKKK